MITEPLPESTDVIVVGGGNAAFTAALAAAEGGARVVLLEKAPYGEHGGNSFYTAGATRVAFDDLAELEPLFDDETTSELLPRTEVPPYPAAEFIADMERVTEGRNDDELTAVLVAESLPTARWLSENGIRYRLQYERQSYETDGRFSFFGNLPLGVVGGGKGLIEQHTAAAVGAGVDIRYGAEVTGLLMSDGRVTGVQYRTAEGDGVLHAPAVVLAAGGFEASPERRRRHLGPGWERAIVRGTPTNTGEVLDLALAAGAQPYGDWSSCHSVAWDSGAPADGGERVLTNQLTRQSYFLGIVVNTRGERFLDEGADYRNYTYARYGREILAQPDGIAFQIFDAEIRPMLRPEEYDSRPITEARADTLEELADAIGVDREAFLRTVREFNEGIVDVPFQPAVKDGRRSTVTPPKSNWSLPIQTGPFYAFGVACGITFTFGGVRIDTTGRVLSVEGDPIPGLFAAGEIAGGLFSGNYPGGSGLAAGSVFGRRAGTCAADHARTGQNDRVARIA